MLALYNLFILLSRLGIGLATIWHGKAQAWVRGRKDLLENLKATIPSGEKIIWLHCASAGEFEQGKPVLEELKKIYTCHKFLITFFSASGYSVGKKYKEADYVFYLPLDTKKNARRFVQVVQPRLVIFVKYDFWYHHLKAINEKGIPLLLISSIFRKGQVFFKPYGGFYRNLLKLFTWIFLQDKASKDLLQSIGIASCSVAGDTRFDRVVAISKNAAGIDKISAFTGTANTVIAGSTWPDDEALWSQVFNKYSDYKLIIAPHQINKSHINKILQLFPTASLYSELEEGDSHQVLIIDNIGMLSRLYQYATITYIGGGFNKSGIHNTLEAAVWSKPVIFGPNYQKFKEARDLIHRKAAVSITSAEELKNTIQKLLTNKELLAESGAAAGLYVHQSKGTTQKIIHYIQEKRLLTIP